MSVGFDVVSLGCAAVDDVLHVAKHPGADGKARVLRRERRLGGLGATAIGAAARIGARCAYAGLIGDDDASRFVVATLQHDGIDCSQAPTLSGAGVVQSSIAVGAEPPTRCILYQVPTLIGADEYRPEASWLATVRVLHLDHYGPIGGLRAATAVRAAGGAVVGDIEEFDDPRCRALVAAIDHLVCSAECASTISGLNDPAAAAAALWSSGRRAVIVTNGAAGCWSIDRQGATPVHHPAFRVAVKDTTGCGDVFHGVYAASLAAKLPLAHCIRQASAAAALTAQTGTGYAGMPNRKALDSFLALNP